MGTKKKLLVFCDRTLSYREVKLFRFKVMASGLLLGVFAFAGLLLLNHFSDDLFGLGYQRMSLLSTENAVLKEQLGNLSKKATLLERALTNLSRHGNELRLRVDLPKVDDDAASVPLGGSVQPTELSVLSREAGSSLGNARKLIDRLEREVRLQEASYEEISKRITYNRVFFAHLPAIKPMEGYYEISGFGMRIHPVLGVYRMHEGIDILNDVGTKVYAAGDGVVQFSGRSEGGYGDVVEISHGYGYVTVYAHLSHIYVRHGQNVKRGQLIAKCGRTGLVSGPHLHYEVRFNGRRQNPVDYFFDDIDASRYRTLLASVQ